MKSNMKKRIIAVMLCMAMLASYGSYALAEGEAGTNQENVQTTESGPAQEVNVVAASQSETSAAQTEPAVSEMPVEEEQTEDTELGVIQEESSSAVSETTQEQLADKEQGVDVSETVEQVETQENSVEDEVIAEAPFYSSCTIGSTTIVVSAEAGVIPVGTALKVLPLSENDEEIVKNTISATVETEDTKVLNTASYDISLWNNGEEIQPNGNVQVIFEKAKRENDAAVFHVTDNKKSATDMAAVSDGNGNQVISTTHFSIYTDAELLNYDFVKADTSAVVQEMAVDEDITGVYKYNPNSTEIAIDKKLDIPELEEGQVWKGKEVIYNGDGTFTVTLYVKGKNFTKTTYNDNGQETGTELVYPVKGNIVLTDTIGDGFEIQSSDFGEQSVSSEGGKVIWTINENMLPTDGTYASITYTIKLTEGAVKATTYETNKLAATMIPDEYNTYYYTHEVVTENVPVVINWNNGMGGEAGINSLTLWNVEYAHTGKVGSMEFEGRNCSYTKLKSNSSNADTMLWYTTFSDTGDQYNKYYHVVILSGEEVLYRLDGEQTVNVDNPGGNGDSYYFTVTEVSEDAIPVPGHEANAIDIQEMGQIQLNTPGAANLQTDKTATVVDWNERTYDIDLYAWHDYVVEQPVSVMIALDVSGSMPWFVTKPTGGTTNLKNIDTEANRKQYNLNTGENKGVKAWSGYKYYVKKTGEGDAKEYKPIGWDGQNWRYIKSKSTGEKMFEEDNIGIVKNDDTIYIRGVSDQTKLEALEEAVTHFVSKIQKTDGSKVGIVTFAGKVTKNYNLENASEFDVNTVFSEVQLFGGTNQYAGLNEAYTQLKNDDSSNKKYLVLFSDGDPTNEDINTNTSNLATDIGKDNKIEALFTAGIFQDKTCSGAANLINWAKPDRSYAKIASSANELVSAFDSIFGMINVSMEGATIKDYIDSRFELVDGDGNVLNEGDTVDGGTVGKDSNGWYVVWDNQTISYATSKDEAWHRTIRVKAKDEYIGGNDVTTNGPGSGISVPIDGQTVNKPFTSPTVNVKVDFNVGAEEVTIFLGDKLESYFTSVIQNEITALQSTTGTAYTMLQDVDVNIQWYTDDECTQMTTVGNIQNATPTDETVYYAKVTVTPKTDGSSSAGNMPDPEGGYYRVDPAGVSKVGTYTVYVISGQIVITKTLEKTSDKDEIFTFAITKNGEEFKTVSITVSAGETSGTMTTDLVNELKNLPRGSYAISEVEKEGYSVKEVAASDETNCKMELSNKTITFTLGTYTENGEDKDTIQTKQYEKGVYGEAAFTNQVVLAQHWGIRKRSEANTSLYLGDAYFYLSKVENSIPSITPSYVGVSSSNETTKGIVSWYKYDQSKKDHCGDVVTDNKLPEGVYQLTEYRSPSGYVKSDVNWTLEINSEGGLASLTASDGEEIKRGNDGTVIYFYYDNEVVFNLPSSGGSGIYWYLFGGVLLMMAASLIVYKNKRREVLKR